MSFRAKGYRRALLCLAAVCACPLRALGQQDSAAAPSQSDAPSTGQDVLVVGHHVAGSAIGEAQPIAVLDSQAIHSLGATSFKEVMDRLKPLATSASGGDPIYLLNGRRISGIEELESLPPEAIERTEILPEAEAVRFGYPPTQRVMNFITKKHFRALTALELGGTTTEGGGGTNIVELNAAKIDGPHRKSLSIVDFRQFPLLQSQRAIAPDPGALYATGGNVTGIGGASIDPALDALVGQAVTSAAVPADAASRGMLTGYLPGANAPAVTDIGAYRSLTQRSDRFSVDGTIGAPVGKTMDGSLNFSLMSQHSDGLNGLAPALLTVPGGSGAFPFSGDVLLYRYLPGVVLHQRSSSLTLHAAATLQGGIHRWGWNVTAGYERVRSTSVSEQGVPLDALQASIDAGGDPMAPIDAASAARRLTDRSRTVTGTITSKAVVNGPLFPLPAGDALLTVSADYARSTSSGEESGAIAAMPSLARSITAASANATLPIASADRNVLAFLGRLSVNGTIGISDVSDYGHLVTSNYGLIWTPKPAVQLSASINNAQTPPPIALLTSPALTTPNTPFFDFTTGTTAFVTALTGGNPALTPERRRTLTADIAVTPIKGKELHVDLGYFDNRIDNQNASLGSVTAAFETAFPALFQRDATGQLVQVDLRPVNLYEERQRELRMTINFSAPLGHAPPKPTAGAAPAKDAPPPKARPVINGYIATSMWLEDKLILQPGAPSLDLLDGATLTGTGGKPRWEMDGDIDMSIGAVSTGVYGRLLGPSRIRSDLATSDLHFSGHTFLVLFGSLDMAKVIHRPWSHSLTTYLTIENLLDDRVSVTDRNGATPNRFQSAYLDPIGRAIRLGIRKQF